MERTLFVPEFRAGTEVPWSPGSTSPMRRSAACPTSAPCPRKDCCPQDLPPTSPACGIPRRVVGTRTRCALGSLSVCPLDNESRVEPGQYLTRSSTARSSQLTSQQQPSSGPENYS